MTKIMIHPDPPVAGQNFTICFDFGSDTGSSVTLDLEWAPSNTPTSVNLTTDNPCVTLSSRSDQMSIKVTGQYGSETRTFA